jgi:hypothetical protein
LSFKKEAFVKKSLIALLGCAVLAGTAAVALAADTMTGWVTEDHCGAKGATASHKECGAKCIKEGHKVAFYDNATKKVMTFDADCQKPMEGMMAQEVTLTGVTMKDGMVHAAKAEPKK